MTALDVVVTIAGVIAVGAGVLVATTRHLVHSALYLVVSLAAVAACFLALTAEFLAWVQVLIYVGAVVVLLLFGIMLTRAPIGPVEDLSGPRRLVAAVIGLAAAGGLLVVLLSGFGDAFIFFDGRTAGSAGATGAAIFRTWVLPFEVLSILLLGALVGAIAISRRRS